MKYSETIKPISYLKAHTAELIQAIGRSKKSFLITQRGEAKAVLQDIRTYEDTQESLALLKLLAQSTRSLEKGRVQPLEKSFSNLRKRIIGRSVL